MNSYSPSFYKKFICSSSNCINSCCQGFDIYLDETSLKIYNNLSDSKLQKMIFSNLSKDDDGTKIKFIDGKCPFFTDEKLCDLQLRGGLPALCYACQRYPRHSVKVGDNLEKNSLFLSCPEVVKTIFADTSMCKEFKEFELKDSFFSNQNTFIEYLIKTIKRFSKSEVLKTFSLMSVRDDYLKNLLHCNRYDKNYCFKEIERNNLIYYYVWNYYDGTNDKKVFHFVEYMVSIIELYLSKFEFDTEDTKIDIVHRLSREIEHSEKNLKILAERI